MRSSASAGRVILNRQLGIFIAHRYPVPAAPDNAFQIGQRMDRILPVPAHPMGYDQTRFAPILFLRKKPSAKIRMNFLGGFSSTLHRCASSRSYCATQPFCLPAPGPGRSSLPHELLSRPYVPSARTNTYTRPQGNPFIVDCTYTKRHQPGISSSLPVHHTKQPRVSSLTNPSHPPDAPSLPVPFHTPSHR